MGYYKKVFASRQEAMQEKASKGFDFLHIVNDEYVYRSQTQDDQYYTNMVQHVPNGEADVVSLVKEEPTDCKIYRYVMVSQHAKDCAPIDHNYKTGLSISLHPNRTFNAGELDQVDWYADKEQTDLVISVVISYTRDTLGFALSRTTTRTWYNEMGQAASPQKITEKIYENDPVLQMDEGKKRRRNLVSIVNTYTLGYMLATTPAKVNEDEVTRQWRVLNDGKKFLSQYKSEYTSFVEDSLPEILDVIKDGTEYWWDNVIDADGTTIRDYVYNELNIYLDIPDV